jgi:diguanylate cyclase (GGDEF)-like protein
MRVLLVEDSPGHAQLVAEQLRAPAAGGWEVGRAASLAAALERLLDPDLPPVDVVLLDLGLPDADGLDAVVRIRTAAVGVPIVVLSGRDDDELALACLRAGAQDHLVKGTVDERLLGRALRHAIERGRRERELALQALHDPLTRLPNRALFTDRLRQAVRRLGRTRWQLAVFVLDVDGFKAVNDREGHAAGDRLLADVAAGLRSALRGGDTAARLGGDEFVVLCEDVDDVAEAQAIAERLLGRLPIPASVGVALASGAGTDPQALLHAADAAMYAVKRRGGGGIAVAGDGARPPARGRR